LNTLQGFVGYAVTDRTLVSFEKIKKFHTKCRHQFYSLAQVFDLAPGDKATMAMDH